MRWFLIDGYSDIVPGVSLRARKLLSCNELFYGEDFPHSEAFAPTLLIEMMAQAGGVLAGVSQGFRKEVVLGKIESADFFKSLYPPQEIIITAKLLSADEHSSWAEMEMHTADGVAARSKIMFALLDSLGKETGEEKIVFTDEFINSYGLAEYGQKVS